MKSMLTSFFLATALLLLSTSGAQALEFTGFFTIDTVEAAPGDHFPVGIYLNDNNLDFAALQIPVRYSNEFLNLDSVSFVGSIKPDTMSASAFDFLGMNRMHVIYLPLFPVKPFSSPGGLVATLWFTMSEMTPPGFLPLDSVNTETQYTWYGANMSDSSGTTYFPDCIGGGIKVLTPTGLDDKVDQNLPANFSLDQNYPNPFNPKTIINYTVPNSGHVKLEVFNILGQSARVLTDRFQNSGSYEAEFDASSFPSGIFFYRLSQDDRSITKKMVLIK